MMEYFSRFDFQEMISAFIVLFAVIDILGSVPIILNLKEQGRPVNAMKATLISFALMLAFFYAGDLILKLFNVDIQSFAVAGALIIFLMSLEMLLDVQIFKNNGPIKEATLIPLVFPVLEQAVHVDFLVAFLIILEKVAIVLLLPMVLGWLIQHYLHELHRRIVSMPNLSFYFWAISLSITTGITVKNIVHSNASLTLLLLIALFTFVLCFIQFAIGRGIGRKLGEEINAGQALFQKNTALSIWVAYMYLNPVASVGAGCYVLWQNIINSFELWQYRKQTV